MFNPKLKAVNIYLIDWCCSIVCGSKDTMKRATFKISFLSVFCLSQNSDTARCWLFYFWYWTIFSSRNRGIPENGKTKLWNCDTNTIQWHPGHSRYIQYPILVTGMMAQLYWSIVLEHRVAVGADPNWLMLGLLCHATLHSLRRAYTPEINNLFQMEYKHHQSETW